MGEIIKAHPTGKTTMVLGLLAAFFLPCSAHDSLYQVIEINEDATGSRTLSISVHLPELATDFGIDPNRADLDWWPELPGTEQKEVLARATQLIAKRFHFENESLEQRFQEPFSEDGVSAATTESTRPGCLVATAPLPKEINDLKLIYSSTEKRLMIVITRPGAFPEVIDRAGGEALLIPLPKPAS